MIAFSMLYILIFTNIVMSSHIKLEYIRPLPMFWSKMAA